MQFTKADATAAARAIHANARAYDRREIDHAEFSARAFALWDAVILGEARIDGSACDSRCQAVSDALERIIRR